MTARRWVLLVLMVVGLAGAWLLSPDGEDRAPWKLCRYLCDSGVCPPCPGDPTPPGQTMAPILVREALTPAGDL